MSVYGWRKKVVEPSFLSVRVCFYREDETLKMKVRAVCDESRTYDNEGVRIYTCSVVVGPTHPIFSTIYGSTGATHFDLSYGYS